MTCSRVPIGLCAATLHFSLPNPTNQIRHFPNQRDTYWYKIQDITTKEGTVLDMFHIQQIQIIGIRTLTIRDLDRTLSTIREVGIYFIFNLIKPLKIKLGRRKSHLSELDSTHYEYKLTFYWDYNLFFFSIINSYFQLDTVLGSHTLLNQWFPDFLASRHPIQISRYKNKVFCQEWKFDGFIFKVEWNVYAVWPKL